MHPEIPFFSIGGAADDVSSAEDGIISEAILLSCWDPRNWPICIQSVAVDIGVEKFAP